MNLQHLLTAPFPRFRISKQNLFWIAVFGISCSLFIILFQPFGIQNVNQQWYFNLAIISMGLVFILSFLCMEGLIPWLFPRLFTQWTLRKALLWYTIVILFVGASMFLYKSFLAGYSDFTIKEYFFVIARTFGIVLIVSFFGLGIYQYFTRKPISIFSIKEDIVLTSPNGKPLRINPNDILYICSDDNYVDIHYDDAGRRKKIIFRSSLKNIEQQLVHLTSPIIRCHRRYLINIDRFAIQKKSSRSMSIGLDDYGDEIPVSRKYADQIKQSIPTRH